MLLNDVDHLQHTPGTQLSTLLTDGPGEMYYFLLISEGEIYYFFTMQTWNAPLKHLKKWRRLTTSIDNITPLPPSP